MKKFKIVSQKMELIGEFVISVRKKSLPVVFKSY
jgi:hypothetical protein